LTAERDYSSTPLWKKVGIKEGSTVSIVGGPEDFKRRLLPLPGGVQMPTQAPTKADVIVVFASRLGDLSKRFASLARALSPAGGLWIAYPKKSAKVPTDLTFENVQRTGLASGLVDNKSCAIDETWTAVRFVYRLKDRPRT
jgi:hypothetical protein